MDCRTAYMTTKSKRPAEAESDESLIREAYDASAWGPPIHVPAKPWARRVYQKVRVKPTTKPETPA
jgi:hypothetical protein